MRKVLLLICLALVFAVPAFAVMKEKPKRECTECSLQNKEMLHGDMMGGMMGEMMGMCLEHADKIGLTDEQLKKLKPLHQEMKKKQVRFMADLKIAEMEQKEIMEVKDFDLEKANAAVKRIADIKTAHHLEMLKSIKEVRSALTDEQFKKLMQIMPMKGDAKPVKSRKHRH